MSDDTDVDIKSLSKPNKENELEFWGLLLSIFFGTIMMLFVLIKTSEDLLLGNIIWEYVLCAIFFVCILSIAGSFAIVYLPSYKYHR